MSHIKRWAKAYLQLSPIYQSQHFSIPNQESIMAINPRLFTAYCLNMMKHSHYSKSKVVQVIKKQYGSCENWWVRYLKQIVDGKVEIISYHQDEAISGQIITFRQLLVKIYNKTNTKLQFTLFLQLYRQLIALNQITEFDCAVIDYSLHSIHQIIQIAQMGLEDTLMALSDGSFYFLQHQANNHFIVDAFSYVTLFNRLKHKIKQQSSLAILQELYCPKNSKANCLQIYSKYQGQRQFIRKQSLSYMFWLLHLNQLAEFIHKFVKQNFLYSQYQQASIHLMCSFLEMFQCQSELNFLQMVLLNELIVQLQSIQDQTGLFKVVKTNIQIQAKLRTMKDHLTAKLHSITNIDDHKWIDALCELNIDFKSSVSINAIKKILQAMVNNQYFKILVDQKTAVNMIKIATMINQNDLRNKIKSKLKGKQQIAGENNTLLMTLWQIDRKQKPANKSIQIKSIYELKRVKTLLQKFNKNSVKYLQYFSAEQSIQIKQLNQCLNISATELAKHKISPTLFSIFNDFVL